jgi:two-component sensor histidine kinase
MTWIAIVTLPVLALLGAWAAWTRTLQNRVAKRTSALREQLRAKVRAEREVRLLLNELDHRVRNLLASIVSLAEQQPAGDRAKQFRADFVGRVRAMATAHDAFRDTNGTGLTFDTALRLLARHLDPNIHERIRREGPDLCMMSTQATPVCLVLHELLTNAMRHGALSVDHGGIMVHTSVQPDGASVLWQEYCNGAPTCEIKPGFGLTLMQGLVIHQLRGRLKVEMGEHGVKAKIFIPNLQECSAEALRESGAAVS